jgi:serine/alanine adding enzyme
VNVRVLGTADDDAWRDAVERLADADIYDVVDYHRVAEANGEGTAVAFLAEEDGALFFHAFLQRPITLADGGWCDLESVYGYGGPHATGDDAFVARCWHAFSGWCSEQRVVAEFVRFNPLSRNERLAPEEMRLVLDRETVAVPLDVDAEALWSGYRSVQRNMVRKAEAAGLVAAEVDPTPAALREFRALYDETMTRVGADEYYVFGNAYYDALGGLGDRLRLFEVRRDVELAAAALFLVHRDRMHYHLAASRGELRRLAPNNLLLHTAASWGLEHGLRTLHLGGGRTSEPEDALLQFKSSVSDVRLPFYTGRLVHDSSMYETLCDRWLQQVRPPERPPYFLLYRLEADA